MASGVLSLVELNVFRWIGVGWSVGPGSGGKGMRLESRVSDVVLGEFRSGRD